MLFDPRLAITFTTVAEELSFTRAAEKLGVAQPWVSEQIRRLEERLRVRLLRRTSRSTELTAHGEAFLPYARALARANDAAQTWAREGQSSSRVFRLGTVDLATDYPERAQLIDGFLSDNPDMRLQIVNGVTEDLFRRLGESEVDAVLAFTTSPVARSGVRIAAPVCRRFAALLVPQEDPIAGEPAVSLRAAAGRTFVTAPGRSDPGAFRATADALVGHGAELFSAPEHNRATIEHLARARRWCCIRWTPRPAVRHHVGDMMLVPVQGTPLQLDLAILTSEAAPHSPLLARLLTLARAIHEEQAAAILGAPGSNSDL